MTSPRLPDPKVLGWVLPLKELALLESEGSLNIIQRVQFSIVEFRLREIAKVAREKESDSKRTDSSLLEETKLPQRINPIEVSERIEKIKEYVKTIYLNSIPKGATLEPFFASLTKNINGLKSYILKGEAGFPETDTKYRIEED